ncbi:hypothetical protein Tcan_14759 [Toxocara canis]|uniref:Uncharacterized protein n=1 Tax=Toxocara canis TaxID=6265 RepID=A0A0B2UQ12_TOXCA|nr:hypothetical protein Tcan_14759 [Toxocara canis]
MNMLYSKEFVQCLLLIANIGVASARMELVKYMSDPVILLTRKMAAQMQMKVPFYKQLLISKGLLGGKSSRRKVQSVFRRPVYSFAFSSPFSNECSPGVSESTFSRRRCTGSVPFYSRFTSKDNC